jgi:hypothetical protein
MKYANQIGAFMAAVVIITCFVTWIKIPDTEITISGFATEGTRYGKPGLVNVFMSGIALVLFLTPKIWAKRVNFFFSGFNLAWAFRNFILLSTCQFGDCPDRQPAFFIYLIASILQLIMAFMPQLELKEK